MNLKQYYNDLKFDIFFKDIKTSSSFVEKGDIFIALKGSKNDGHNYINEAINKGAVFVICQKHIDFKNHYVVKDTKDEANKLLAFYYPNDLDIIGITGTDGKTTCSYIIYNILNYNNTSSYMGTNGIISSNFFKETKNTTPSSEIIHKSLNEFCKNNINKCVMEVSSEGILGKRVDTINFNTAIFTNLSHEHLNTHKTMKNYFNCKNKLFKSLNSYGLAVINIDDKYHKKIKTKGKIITYGIKKGKYRAKNIELCFDKTLFDLYIDEKFITRIETSLFGVYNVYNALCAISFAHTKNISLDHIKRVLKENIHIDGRFEVYTHNDIRYITDFAHTPNALYNLLSSLKKIKHNKIIHVLGSAGEKDSSKRNKMSNISCALADIVILTSEDPKNESLLNIFCDLTNKLKYDNYYLCVDRKEAIKLAVRLASSKDIVLISGKGNEKFENIMGHNIKHNDLEEVKKALL